MSTAVERIVSTREAAHAAARTAYEVAQHLIADGKRVKISVEEDLDDLSVRQRRFLHGPVLGQIAEQVRVGEKGDRYVAAIWKEFFRQLFLPDRFVSQKIPRWDDKAGRVVQPKRATPHRQRQSTEDLNVKQYSEFIDRVIAHAATEFGVAFHFLMGEREAASYQPAPRAKRKQAEGQPA